MPPTRSRAAALAAAVTLSMVFAGLALPVAAADDPTAAVDQLLDAVEAGEYEAIDVLVCEAERETLAAMLDPGEAMGVEEAGEAVSVTYRDREVSLVSEDGDTATVNVTGTMSMDIEDADLEAVARAMVETESGEVSDDDLQMMLPFLEMALNQSLPLDEELTVVRENGEWVVCGGFGEEPDESIDGFEPEVSDEGICALATPAELTAVGPLVYDSSSGFESFCNYSNSDWEAYHQTGISVEFDRDAQSTAEAYGADQQLTVGGAPAWAPGPDGFGTNIIVQAGPDILVLSVGVPEDPPAGFDWLAQGTAIAELLVPRLADVRLELAPATPMPTPEPTPEVPICDAALLAEIESTLGLGFESTLSDSYGCTFMSNDGDPGYHSAFANVVEVRMDDYRTWIGEHEDVTIAGYPGVTAPGQTVIELPDRGRVMTFTVSLDTSDPDLTLSADEVVEYLVERIVPAVPEVEPVTYLCDYVDLDAVNDLGLLEFSAKYGFDETSCSLVQEDPELGFLTLSIYRDTQSLEDARQWYPDGAEVTVAGRPGYVTSTDVIVETSAGGDLSFSVFLPVGSSLTPAEVNLAVAELVVANLEAAEAE